MSAVSLPTNRLPARISHSHRSRVYWLVPIVVLDIEAGAGGDELIHHERVTLPRGHHERSVPADESAAGSDIAQPLHSISWLVPTTALEIEAGAGGDELIHHERVTHPRGQHERSAPADESAAGSDIAQPLQSRILARTHCCSRHRGRRRRQ